MLMIKQIYEPENIRSSIVRCPTCKHGRLCDRPAGEKAMAIAIHGDATPRNSNRIILKCPKCSRKFLIGFTKE